LILRRKYLSIGVICPKIEARSPLDMYISPHMDLKNLEGISCACNVLFSDPFNTKYPVHIPYWLPLFLPDVS